VNLFPMYHKYWCDDDHSKRSKHPYDLVGEVVKLRRNRGNYFRYHQSPFKGVSLIPIKKIAPEWCLGLLKVQPKRKKLSKEHFIRRFLDSLIEAIAESWIPNGFNVVCHSSGWDSRLHSCILKRLADERGSGWLGHVLFVCFGPECTKFRKIMEYEGWDTSQFLCVGDPGEGNILPLDENRVNFQQAWRKMNGGYLHPVNLWYNLYESLLHGGYLPRNQRVRLWCGQYHNEMFNRFSPKYGESVGSFLNAYYYTYGYSVQAAALPCNVFFPALNKETLSLFAEFKSHYNRKEIRQEAAAVLDPGLGRLERYNLPNYEGNLTEKAHLLAVKDYKESWYAAHVQPYYEGMYLGNRNRNVGWLHWSIASVIEHLIKEGHKIELC